MWYNISDSQFEQYYVGATAIIGIQVIIIFVGCIFFVYRKQITRFIKNIVYRLKEVLPMKIIYFVYPVFKLVSSALQLTGIDLSDLAAVAQADY